MKSAFVSIIGRPSSGKSTFLNKICGHKVSIISTVPQTTRNRIRGILNSDKGQLVFIDTPGFHLSDKKINLRLKELVFKAIKEVDVVLYLLDVSRAPGEEELLLMDLLAGVQDRLVIGFNKIDIKENYLDQAEKEILNAFRKPRVHEISALNGQGLEELINDIFALAPEGERLYPEEYYTDQPPEFRISEIIREKAINSTHSEVPHAIFVDISDLEMRENMLWARGFIYVERESQKGILVGRNGVKIKTIVRTAEQELNEIFPYQVKLDIRVKVRPKWRKNDNLLKNLIN